MTSDSVFIDVAFPMSGRSLPLDHGYPLFGAVSRVVPLLHKEPSWGIHPVHGLRVAPGVLQLGRSSLLTIRAPVSEIAALLPLAGQTLDVGGCPAAIGVPRIYPLSPSSSLHARFVTIKSFDGEGATFAEAVRRQLNALEISNEATLQVGSRRVVRVSNHTIVGFSLDVGGLSDAESTRLQTRGIGGRRHMGAGLFLPAVRQ